MGRPFKSGIDYFPLDVKLDDEFELIEAEHGIKGFGVLIKIWQKVYANNYWIKWDKKTIIVFSNRINVDINSVNEVINSCLEWGIFDKKLYKSHEILTSKGIQKRFFEIVKRRKNIEVIDDYLLIDPVIYVDINSINVSKSTQSKGKESKQKETKLNPLTHKEKFIEKLPESVFKNGHSKEQVLNTIDDLIDYCKAHKNKRYDDYYAALRNFLKKVVPENKINGNGKLSFEKYKEAFIWKNENPSQKFNEKALNEILIGYPLINEYEHNSAKFELTYKEYLKL